MFKKKVPPKEGDIYKTVTVGQYTFELCYGYYEEFERDSGEPVVIYPDLREQKIYTQNGQPIVTAIQDPCVHYEVPQQKSRDECCNDCVHFEDPEDEIGICKCPHNQVDPAWEESIS
ncbi:MAG: hypothetical protein IJ036_04290 [Lachnospiraceae bacterium]|nr:hypothetical protein [Lachnospiraceae bacterium]